MYISYIILLKEREREGKKKEETKKKKRRDNLKRRYRNPRPDPTRTGLNEPEAEPPRDEDDREIGRSSPSNGLSMTLPSFPLTLLRKPRPRPVPPPPPLPPPADNKPPAGNVALVLAGPPSPEMFGSAETAMDSLKLGRLRNLPDVDLDALPDLDKGRDDPPPPPPLPPPLLPPPSGDVRPRPEPTRVLRGREPRAEESRKPSVK